VRSIYSAGRQGKKFVLIQAAFIAFTAFGGGLAWSGSAGYAVTPAVFLIGLACYGRRYLMGVRIDHLEATLQLDTLLFLWRTTFTVPVEDVVTSTFHDLGNGTQRTPFYAVRLRGRRIPFVLDLQGDVLEPEALTRALRLEEGGIG
jgi:hypothetical protein